MQLQHLQEVLDTYVNNGSIAGVNVLITEHGKELAYAESGCMNIASKTPVRRDTIWRMYSSTKPITSAAVMLLVSRGLIDLSAGLEEYLPEFHTPYVSDRTGRRPAGRNIRVADLMNMTSGIPYPHDKSAGGRASRAVFDEAIRTLGRADGLTTREFARRMAEADLDFDPGAHFAYGASADILGALVEVVSGMSFAEFLGKEFFEPLDMNDTGFSLTREQAERLADIYDYVRTEDGSPDGSLRGRDRLKLTKTCHLGLSYERTNEPTFASGGAGLTSTLDDYSHFAAMLLNGGEYRGNRILPKAAVDFMTSGGLTDDQKKELMAGWDWLRGYTYGNLMRVLEKEDEASILANRGEYGWDGWLGTFFSNEPATGRTLLVGMQQIGQGEGGKLVRILKNLSSCI